MLNLILVIHCHQPIGNFDHVFDMARKKCYRPLVEILESHPAVKLGLHFSGQVVEPSAVICLLSSGGFA
jgi:alpha-amylase